MFILTALNELYKSQLALRLSQQKLRELQLKKFRKLVKHCYNHSPYYRKIIENQKIDITNCIPEDFPILDKKTLMENFDQIVTNPKIKLSNIKLYLEENKDPTSMYLDKYHVIRTSGSSGEIGVYLYHEDELATVFANVVRSGRSGINQKMAFIGKIDDHYAGVTMATAAKRLPLIYKSLLLIDVNEPISDIIEKLNKYQPTNIGGYAFIIARLAQYQKKGVLKINPKVIQVGGEPMSIPDKELIEEVFNQEVINVYACSETLLLAIGKSDYNHNMKIMEDCVYLQIFDHYILCTNLFNYTLPLIRFKINDDLNLYDVYDDITPFKTIMNIVGRNDLNPYFINDDGQEDFISGLVFHTLIVKGISIYQLIAHSKESCTMNIVLNEDIKEARKKTILSNMKKNMDIVFKQKRMTKVKYDIKIIDDIKPDQKTGKFKSVVIENMVNKMG
jgi:phenylacetate-CoA ligase